MTIKTIRVVPTQHSGTGPTPSQGTKLYCGDELIAGVTKVVLTAQVGDRWTATIECSVKVDGEIIAEVEETRAKQEAEHSDER